jgi:hypothetical protein
MFLLAGVGELSTKSAAENNLIVASFMLYAVFYNVSSFLSLSVSISISPTSYLTLHWGVYIGRWRIYSILTRRRNPYLCTPRKDASSRHRMERGVGICH